MPDPKGDRGLASADIRLFETGNLADATVICDDRAWKVHKVIVSSRCKWFETAFYGKFAEAVSGKVVLEEQDPDLIDILLRFIYTRDIDIPKLKNGEDLPVLCIKIFRLGDFFLIDELKAKATAELNAYINTELRILDTDTDADTDTDMNTDDGQSPYWLTEVLDALEEAYKDTSTGPILEILLKFVRLNKREVFKFKDATALLDNIPEMAKDLIKGYLAGDNMAVESRTSDSRLKLPVLTALRSSNELFESETATLDPVGSAELPCLLCPVVNNPRVAFTVVSPITEQEIDSLSWISPRVDQVDIITSHNDSKIVRVDMLPYQHSKNWMYIRFNDRKDAQAFVEGYCRADPDIESLTGSNATRMSAAMRVRVARVSDTSRWLRQIYWQGSHWIY